MDVSKYGIAIDHKRMLMSTAAISHSSTLFRLRPLIEKAYYSLSHRIRERANPRCLKTSDLDTYLMESGLKDAVLTSADGVQIAGPELTELVDRAVAISRLVETVGRQLGNRDVIEQAVIAGLLNRSMLDNTEAAAYLAKRLEARAAPLEKGWTGSVETSETGPAIVVQRRLRGISERYQIDARIVGRARRGVLMTKPNICKKSMTVAELRWQQQCSSGPSELPSWCFRQSVKGFQISL